MNLYIYLPAFLFVLFCISGPGMNGRPDSYFSYRYIYAFARFYVIIGTNTKLRHR